jgi:predicted metal-dependent hydrolase
MFFPELPVAPVAVKKNKTRGPVKNVGAGVAEALEQIFAETYRELRPRAPMPAWHIRFYKFAHVNNTIRLREGTIHVRLSDVLEAAPDGVLRAIAHILLAKMYRKPVSPQASARFRRHVNSEPVSRHAEHIRQSRGRKRLLGAQGETYDLNEVFDSLNRQFFHGLMGRPVLTWSAHAARRLLGHYDAAHNTIVISKIFDRPRTPRYAVEYLVYHEMLHLKHPVRLRGSQRCIHPPAFQKDEREFPELEEARAYLKRL